jgi:hypothetical protein
MPYSIALGLLVPAAVHLKSPGAVIAGYTAFACLTALRFKALKWKVGRAFIPLGIVVGAAALAPVLGPTNVAVAHGVAFFAQLFMSVRAGIATGPLDPMSREQALARDFLARRRETRRAIKDIQPAMAAHKQATERLNELRAELAGDIETHGTNPSPKRALLMQRVAEQTALVKASTERLKVQTEQLRDGSSALREATAAWKNRNHRDAA